MWSSSCDRTEVVRLRTVAERRGSDSVFDIGDGEAQEAVEPATGDAGAEALPAAVDSGGEVVVQVRSIEDVESLIWSMVLCFSSFFSPPP